MIFTLLIFVLYQKNLKSSNHYNPKVITAINIGSIQLVFLVLLIFILLHLKIINPSFIKGLIFLVPLGLIIGNHYLFVRGDYLDKVRNKYLGSNMDTKRNKNIVFAAILLFITLSFFLVMYLSYVKSKG